MHVLMVFIFIVFIYLFYHIICNVVITNDNFIFEHFDNIDNNYNDIIPEYDTESYYKYHRHNYPDEYNYDENIKNINTKNINTKNINDKNINIKIINKNNFDDEYNDEYDDEYYDEYYDNEYNDDEYNDEYNDDEENDEENDNEENDEEKNDDYVDYDEYEDEYDKQMDNNTSVEDINLNKPYLNKKYYYNNIGTIMTGQEFTGTNIKIGENDETIQYSAPKNSYTLDDGMDGSFLLHNNLCSKSCCSEQYPVPFKLQYDKYVCQNKNEFIPSSYICNNSMQDSGCLCMTKKQGSFIYNRGGNA